MNSYLKLKILFIVLVGQVLTSCVSSPPKPSETEYVVTTGAQFLIDTKIGTIKYGMNYHLKKDIGTSPSYIAIFENPQPNSENLVIEGSISSGERELNIESPLLPGIKNNQSYNVTLKLLSNGNLVTEHHQEILFNLPQHILEQTNITVY